MSRKRRKDDFASAGRSDVCPFIPGEPAGQRHSRRLHTNLRGEADVRRWAESHGINFDIFNQGHHWKFWRNTLSVDWWPSSAKLIRNKRWNGGVHTHDFKQAMAIVAEHFGVTAEKESNASQHPH